MIILCGSAHQPRSTRNPWTVEERELMIRSALTEDENKRVHLVPLMDAPYNDKAWVSKGTDKRKRFSDDACYYG